MLKFFVVMGVALLAVRANAQEEGSCCQHATTSQSGFGPAEMALLANDQKFVQLHESPLPGAVAPEEGEFVTFPTADSIDGRVFEVKSPAPSDKVILMFHEWWGLNEYIQQEAVRLQNELGNVTVLAVDLYDGKVATTPEEAGKLTQSVTKERGTNIIKGVLNYVGADAGIATIGWCFGGSWSHQAALLGGNQTRACVIYYGMPEMDVDRLRAENGPVLGIFAKQDGWVTPEKVKEFETAMKKAGKKLTVQSYDAAHAFANPSNLHHDKKAAEDANKRTVKFLKRNLL